jgi:DNA-directed RNA polymerase beta' subunit
MRGRATPRPSMTTRLVPASGANFVEAGSVVSRQLVPRIVAMQFGIMSPAQIERIAAKVITDNTVYAKNLPRLNGPNDPALGPSDRRVRCATCQNTWFGCPGHLGVIRLPIPVYHVGFVDFVYKILQCFCWACSCPLGSEDDPRIKASAAVNRGIVQFTQVFVMGRGRFTCKACSAPQPKYSKVGMVISRLFTPKKLAACAALGPALAAAAARRFTPADALDILAGISDEHCRMMGMDPAKAHPSWMIMQNLAVLPPNARPAIMASEGSKRRGQDDITSQTQDIIKTCRALRRAILKAHDEGAAPGAGKKGANLTPAAKNSSRASNKRKAPAPAAEEDEEDAAMGDEDSSTMGGGGGITAAAAAAAVLNARIAIAEFSSKEPPAAACAAAAGPPAATAWTEEEVAALRFAMPEGVLTPSAAQVAAIWDQFPLLCEKVQNSVTILYDNSGKFAPQARQRTGGAKKSLMDRIVGKGGRIRGNLVAKRVDLSARTVIIPDATLDVDELGIPNAFATILTMQEDVNSGNVGRLQAAVAAGHGVLGGASRILHATGEMTQLQYVDSPGRAGIRLQVGDTVERHLLDGDRVVFNRQPSLHKLSVMVHRIRLIDGLAIAVPLAVVEPYNADFDGDEMNVHVLQSMLANAEAVELMAVSRNVMNPQNNEPCLSLVQDVRVGGMLLTARDTRLGRDAMHQCVGVIRYPVAGKERIPPPAGYDPEPYWTGKQLVSMIMPSIFIEKRVRGAGPEVGADDPAERYVLIEDGHLLAGTLCKATLGTCTGGITHRICTAFGQEAAVRFLSDFQRIVYVWLPCRGLTMGLGDCVIPAAVQEEIDRTTGALDELVAGLTREAADLREHMTATEAARVEAGILTLLTSNLDYASRLVIAHQERASEASGTMGGFRAMVLAGSKGNTNNIAQVMAYLGQQVVDGNRIAPSNVSRRTLPMFPAGAYSAAARGFIMSSYMTGMAPHEFFNHMQAGREGLVATAVKTAETGYKYRSMAKGQETNIAQWDGSVRNAQNYIIEFVAGGDGMDPTRVERVPMPVLTMGRTAIAAAMGGSAAAERVIFLRDALRSGLLTLLYRELTPKVLLPVNIPDEMRRVAFGLTRRPGRAHFAADCAPSADAEYAAVTADLVAAVVAVLPSAEAAVSLELAIRWECRPAALRAAGLNAHAYKHILASEILQRTLEALVQPGEAVGVVAAQSIGEPSTQFTLDAFHQAGLVQRRMSVGVPRLKELLHASDRIATPSMVVPLRDKGASKAEADRLGRSLQFLCVDAVLHSSYVQHDPPGDGVRAPLTCMAKDRELMEHTTLLYGQEQGGEGVSPWVIRLVLNRCVLAEHGKTPEDVAREICKQLGGDCKFGAVYSQPNMAQWVIRLRLGEDVSERGCRLLHARVRASVLLGGIDGIRDARAIELKRSVINADGGVEAAVEVVIDTGGSALMRVATRDWADWERTTTNDVQEVARTLGMAAARALLFAELDRVISYDGGYVDPRHLKALTNTMTHRGYIMSMTRHGINRVDFSVLQRASYEEPVDMIQQAALTAERDDLNGMCQAILAGQKVPVGTGTVSIQQDVESGAGLTQFGRAARHSLSSREHVALTVAGGGRQKRVRENLAPGRGPKSVRTVTAPLHGAPAAAVSAWGAAAPQPSRRASARPPVAAAAQWTLRLSGEVVTTMAGGLSGAAVDAAPQADTAPALYRPSSPSELLDGGGGPAKRARRK